MNERHEMTDGRNVWIYEWINGVNEWNGAEWMQQLINEIYQLYEIKWMSDGVNETW